MTLIPDLERQLVAAASRRRTRRRFFAVSGAALTIAALGAFGFVGLGAGDRNGGGSAVAGDVSPSIAAQLGVFRRPRTASDELRGDPLADLESTGDRRPGEDPSLSRRVELPDGSVYLWPMQGGVCNSWGSSGGCTPIETLTKTGVVTVTSMLRSPESGKIIRLQVLGIAVDSVRSVQLLRPGATEISATVTDNVFWVDLTNAQPLPNRIQWEDERGEHTERLDLL